MADDHDRVDLALRSVEIVDADGALLRRVHVFCPVRHESLEIEDCRHCERCESFPRNVEETGAHLRCRAPGAIPPKPEAGWYLGREPASAFVSAGSIASTKLVCARFDAPMSAVREALERNGVSTALIVDEHTHVLAVVGHAELEGGETTPVLVVGDLEVTQIDESAPLADVISRMLHHHAHKIALVRSDKTAAALLTDLDVLRWIAVAGSH